MKRTLKEERKRRVMFYDIWFWLPVFIIPISLLFPETDLNAVIAGLIYFVLPILMWFRLLYFAIKRKDWGWVVLGFLGGFLYFFYYLFVIRKAISEGKEKTIGHTKELKQREKKKTQEKRKKYHENIRRRAI